MLNARFNYFRKSLVSILQDLIVFACNQFASFEKVEEVEEFFANRSMPSIARTLKQSLERVNINANWVKSIQAEKNLGEATQELAYRKY